MEVQPLRDLLNALLNDEEVDESDIIYCLSIVERIETKQRLEKFDKENKFRLVSYENE